MNLKQAHQPGNPGIADVLILNKGGGILHALDAPLGPGIGLLLDGTKAWIAQASLPPGPVLAVAHQHGHQLRGHAQIADKAQENFQLLGVEAPTQQPLNLAVKTPEVPVAVHSLKHIPLGVAGTLSGGNVAHPVVQHQAQLPQGGLGTAKAGLVHMQFRPGVFPVVAAASV